MLQPGATRQLLPRYADVHSLTARERQVLLLEVEGLATKHIARELGLSPYTVNDHLKSIYRNAGPPDGKNWSAC